MCHDQIRSEANVNYIIKKKNDYEIQIYENKTCENWQER